MNLYVLFVKAGHERKVELLLKKRLDSNISVPFIPLHEKFFKVSGIVRKELKTLFPGYVFIKSKLTSLDFLKEINTLIYFSCDIIKILRYSDTEISLKESEKLVLFSLLNSNYCIESSNGIIEGDKVHILDGPLKGLESIIKKINRHKRQAQIEMEIMGDICTINIALDIVYKVD